MKTTDISDETVIVSSLKEETYVYLKNVLKIFFDCLRAIVYYREIQRVIKLQTINEDYLQHFANLNYDIAILEWNKLFGSESSQNTHYTNLFKYSDLKNSLAKINIKSTDELIAFLIAELKIPKGDFEEYQKNSMRMYRDKFIAHFDLEVHTELFMNPESEIAKKKRLTNLPTLDLAIESLFILYELVKKIIQDLESNNGSGYPIALFERNLIEIRLLDEIKKFTDSLKQG